MIVYKGTTEGMTSTYGGCTDNEFEPGKSYQVENSDKLIKTVSYGYHAYEYPLKCTNYYSLNGKNKFWKCRAYGNMDEDNDGKVASEKIEWLRELSVYELAVAAVSYITCHPKREDWEIHNGNVVAAKDEAEISQALGIAIARGENPKVKAPAGAVVALITEVEGTIFNAKVITVPTELDNKWIQLRRKE